MNQPLGNYAGLLCEIIESIESLKGNGPQDLMNVVYELGIIALNMAGENDARVKIENVINDGSALEVFYGSIRGGLDCTNGVCRYIQSFEDGVKIDYNVSFN